MLNFYIDDNVFEYRLAESFKFSAGERQVRLNWTMMPEKIERKLVIRADVLCADDLMVLLLTVDALKRLYGNLSHVEKVLYLPYLPYSRQDRVCAKGEALSIAVFAKLVNLLGFDRVVTLDCHSEVGPALIDNLQNIQQADMVSRYVLMSEPSATLICPDAGAAKKIWPLVAKAKRLVKADKVRNTLTGNITSTAVYTETLTGEHCLIVDDICDGGRTFIELAHVLRAKNAASVSLWVTHGIFSKGLSEFEKIIDNIYFSDSFPAQSCAALTTQYWSMPVVENLIRQEFK